MKSTISKAHVRIFRAVEGAVRNTAHGHPRWHLTKTMATSIAKRATGTLTAEWPDVLAARLEKPSDSVNGDGTPAPHWPPRRYATMTARKGGDISRRHPPLHLLWKKLSIKIGEAKREAEYTGNTERVEGLIEAIRLLDQTIKRSK